MGLIYEHWRPDTNECFYVGASCAAINSRPYEYVRDNNKYMAVIADLSVNSLTPFTKIIWDNLDDYCTGTYEKIRIAYQKAVIGDKLTNKALGGFGLNLLWDEELRAQHSKILSVAGQKRWDAASEEEKEAHGARSLAGRKKWEESVSEEEYAAYKESLSAPLRKRPKELRSRVTREFQARKTPEERSAIAQKGADSQTPEQHRNNALKAAASRTYEQRCESARKGIESLTPEQLRERAAKGWEKRRENGTDKLSVPKKGKSIVVGGVEFPSVRGFARFVGRPPTTIKKLVDAGKFDKLEELRIAAQ